mgnify:CR=1 FL=1
MTYVLKIFIENEELRQKYEISINEHNKQIYNRFHNAGFDLFCPEEISLNNNKVELNYQHLEEQQKQQILLLHYEVSLKMKKC